MDDPDQSQTELFIKIAFIFVIFAEGVLFGIIPQKWKKCRKNEKILSVANAFSGGVFLAIAFVHIIPETAKLYYEFKFEQNKLQYPNKQVFDQQTLINAREQILANNASYEAEIYKLALIYIEESYSQFPLPFVLVLTGYAFILLIDKVIIAGGGHHDQPPMIKSPAIKGNPFHETEKVQSPMTTTVRTFDQQVVNIQGEEDMYYDFNQASVEQQSTNSESSEALDTVNNSEVKLRKEFKKMVSRTDKFSTQFFSQMKKNAEPQQPRLSKNKKLFLSFEVQRQSITNKQRKMSYMSQTNVFFDNPYLAEGEKGDQESKTEALNIHPDSFINKEEQPKSRFRCKCNSCGCGYLQSLILLIALSTHAIFEGIALGLTSDTSATINIIIGLLCHKGPAAMSLGISLSKKFKNDADRNKAVYLIIFFALATPIGIAIGLAISNTNNFVEITFNSFAGGTFIYIAASEVIVEEFSLTGNKFIKMLFFSLGATLITCMWLIES